MKLIEFTQVQSDIAGLKYSTVVVNSDEVHGVYEDHKWPDTCVIELMNKKRLVVKGMVADVRKKLGLNK